MLTHSVKYTAVPFNVLQKHTHTHTQTPTDTDTRTYTKTHTHTHLCVITLLARGDPAYGLLQLGHHGPVEHQKGLPRERGAGGDVEHHITSRTGTTHSKTLITLPSQINNHFQSAGPDT